MPCENQQQAWLAARYAGEQASSEVTQHVASCETCSAFVRRQEQLDGVLALNEAATPRPGFDTRFFARLEEQKREHVPARGAKAAGRVRRWLWGIVPLTAAAALGLVLYQRDQKVRAVQETVAVAKDLELIEDLPVVQHLDEVEAYEALADVPPDDIDALANEGER
jgi:hypothetical protein